jgi:hypothetical protein
VLEILQMNEHFCESAMFVMSLRMQIVEFGAYGIFAG